MLRQWNWAPPCTGEIRFGSSQIGLLGSCSPLGQGRGQASWYDMDAKEKSLQQPGQSGFVQTVTIRSEEGKHIYLSCTRELLALVISDPKQPIKEWLEVS